MKAPAAEVRTLATVTDYTRLCQLPAPAHPLLALIDLEKTRNNVLPADLTPLVQQLYTVWVKKNLKGRVHYGHQSYDFGEGVMGFMAPGQMFAVDASLDISAVSGWMLMFHPDLLLKHPLGQKIAGYGFFSYQVHEALHLSAQEEALLDGLLAGIRAEYERPIDAFSQDVIVAQLDVLLTTSLTINETAFRLGFEYPQYFSRLFKRKTGLTPAAFRFSAQ